MTAKGSLNTAALQPAQRKLYRQITKAGMSEYGLPLADCREADVTALMKANLVTVWYGRVVPIWRRQASPDA